MSGNITKYDLRIMKNDMRDLEMQWDCWRSEFANHQAKIAELMTVVRQQAKLQDAILGRLQYYEKIIKERLDNENK